MALVCNTINAGAAIDCDAPPVAGTNNFVYLMNKDDVSTITTDADGTVTAIAMKSTKQAYKYETGNTAVNGLYALRQSGVLNGFGHTMTIIYPENDATAISNLSKLANANVMAIVNQRGDDGFGTFRLLGKTHGLIAENIEGDFSNGDRDGLPFVTLSTDERFNEKSPPVHVLNTDYATTLSDLEALLTPAA